MYCAFASLCCIAAAYFAALIHTSSADTPANCSYEDVLGTWEFYIGPAGFDRTIDCSTSWMPMKTLTLSLLFPDKVMDEFSNEGFWTMIYNQGFEVQLDNRKYFAFSNYTMDNNTTISYCASTLTGSSHDFWGHNWACYYGQKTLPPAPHFERANKVPEVQYDAKYVNNPTFMRKINTIQKLWIATSYSWMEGWTLRMRLKRAGGLSQVGYPKPADVKRETLLAAKDLPDFFDWRNVSGANYVSPVRNQGSCGSCYAFASMAMLEARIRIKTRNHFQPVFSPQDVVGCSKYSQGCDGGFPYLIAGKYAEDYGVVEEKCFPYIGKDSTCNTESDCLRYYSTNYYYVGGFYGACNEKEMMIELVNNGPIVVGFEVYADFAAYKSGIYHHTGLEDKFNPWEITNHAVLVVGYGVEEGQKYWIVKNSWSPNWGEQGYFRIVRGTDDSSFESMAVAATPLVP